MEIRLCDNCKQTMMSGIDVTCGYGSYLDGENLDFCRDECLVEFFTKKIAWVKRLEKRRKR